MSKEQLSRAMKPIISRIFRLAPGILAGSLLSMAPARADSTISINPPRVTKFVVTCEYVEGYVSPLQMHVDGQGMGFAGIFAVEFKSVQTGLSHTQTPLRMKTVGTDTGIFMFPGLQPGIYDVTVAWGRPNSNLPLTSEAMVVFKHLKIPDITLTGGRGTGCQL